MSFTGQCTVGTGFKHWYLSTGAYWDNNDKMGA